MDYEKNKEAFVIVKQMVADGQISQEVAEKYFPELAESEDERIRKALIDGFKRYNDGTLFNGCLVKDIIVWLEKQCEQKEVEPTPIFRIGDILKRKGKDYTFRVDRIQGGYYHCDRNHGAFFPIEEQNNWELVEQKPAEWSDTDYVMQRAALEILMASPKTVSFTILKESVIVWLKSLKERYTWKPSEEQMKVLNEVINFAADHGTMRWNDYIYNVLKSLREQLKKLKD